MKTCLLFLLLAIMVQVPLRAAAADPIAADEQTLAVEIKALEELSPAVREAAATRIRTILAKYPGRSTNLREADAGEARWKAVLAEVRPGMTEEAVVALLKPLSQSGSGSGAGPSPGRISTYVLDREWVARIRYGGTGVVGRPELIARVQPVNVWPPPANFTGTWTTWYVNGQKHVDRAVVNGANTSARVSYHSNGRKSSEAVILDAALDEILSTQWDENGVQTGSARLRAGRPVAENVKSATPSPRTP